MENVSRELIERHHLPENFIETVNDYYLPLTKAIAGKARNLNRPLFVGINGAQGTGKSTLASFLCELLLHGFQLRSLEISIDDLYLSKAARNALAREVHPLLAVRGVPGTHNIDLGLCLLEQLASADNHSVTAIPRFDKAVDDCCLEDTWVQFQGRPDVIILEGWCVGARPQPVADLQEPINGLERARDGDGRWRRYVNDQLAGPYQNLFGLLDLLVMIRAPSFSCVYDWRLLQEEKLERSRRLDGLSTTAVMGPDQVREFIMYYERLTTWQLREMPSRTDALLEMDQNHNITAFLGDLITD